MSPVGLLSLLAEAKKTHLISYRGTFFLAQQQDKALQGNTTKNTKTHTQHKMAAQQQQFEPFECSVLCPTINIDGATHKLAYVDWNYCSQDQPVAIAVHGLTRNSRYVHTCIQYHAKRAPLWKEFLMESVIKGESCRYIYKSDRY